MLIGRFKSGVCKTPLHWSGLWVSSFRFVPGPGDVLLVLSIIIRTSNRMGWHQCSICQKAFPRPSKLKHHIAYHHEKKFSFECRLCGKPYSNQDHVNRHYRTVHGEEMQKKIRFKHFWRWPFVCCIRKIFRFLCKEIDCRKTFVNKQNLDRHIRLAHENKNKKSVQVIRQRFALKVSDC